MATESVLKTGRSTDAWIGTIEPTGEMFASATMGLAVEYKHDICGRKFRGNHEPKYCPICACNDAREWAKNV